MSVVSVKDQRRAIIKKGVADVEAALKHVGQADRALIFARIVRGLYRADAAAAIAALGQVAERRAKEIGGAARNVEFELSDPARDPRPVMVLELKGAVS